MSFLELGTFNGPVTPMVVRQDAMQLRWGDYQSDCPGEKELSGELLSVFSLLILSCSSNPSPKED